ncbi:hypothetical protein CAP36_09890 [Chitinophagaceae bacterium IBVUCB2]|nr:hypothetical protein CAP36_09890 [Chitinophagaceae bacterium IBVUCB2]
MKKLFLLLTLILTTLITDAQKNSWNIKLNNKIVLSTTKEDEEKNIVKIKTQEGKKEGYLEIKFTEAEPDTWWRSFLFYDEDDNEVLRKDSVTSYKIKLGLLRKSFSGKKLIRIYTTISPKDPNLAVRIRRVHLCTLRLQ